jgi:ribonuclease P protein component
MGQRLCAAEHIKRRADFEAAYQEGLKVSGRYMLVFLRRTEQSTPRLGIAATRKMGGAVVRNLAKRRVRELFRHHKPSTALDVVVVPRRELVDAPFASLEIEFRALLDRRVPERGVPRRARRHTSV